MIAVVVSDLLFDWADALLGGMLSVFGPQGWTPFVAIHGSDPELAQTQLLSSLHRNDEGVVCQPIAGADAVYERFRDSGVPLILVGDYPDKLPDAHFVGWDARSAARIAVEHLIETGRDRIGFVGTGGCTITTRGRYEAYLETLRDAGMAVNERWIAIPSTEEDPARIAAFALSRMFGDGAPLPDALFAVDDRIGLSLVEVLEDRDIRVPEDIAVIGMGDLPLSKHNAVSLSTVVEPVAEMGRQAAELLAKLMRNPVAGPVHMRVRGEELIVRRTTMPAGWNPGAS